VSSDSVDPLNWAAGTGYCTTDTGYLYTLAIPPDYRGCYIQITADKRCYDTFGGARAGGGTFMVMVPGHCESNSGLGDMFCKFSVTPGETITGIKFNRYPGRSYSCESDLTDTNAYRIQKFGWCGDGACSGTAEACINGALAQETCSSCPSDCGSCSSPSAPSQAPPSAAPVSIPPSTAPGEAPETPQLKTDSSSCSDASECSGGYCVHEMCRSTESYCGDGFCDLFAEAGKCTEDCIQCNSDADCASKKCGACASGQHMCGVGLFFDFSACQECVSDSNCKPGYKCADEKCVQKSVAEQETGGSCTTDEACKASEHCQNNVCCEYLRECCRTDADCAEQNARVSEEGKKRYVIGCLPSVHYCGSRYYDGGVCLSGEECVSGNCRHMACCGQGKECCNDNHDCPEGSECDYAGHYCKKEYTGIGAECLAHSSCEEGLYCWKSYKSSTYSGVCREPDNIVTAVEPAGDEEGKWLKHFIEYEIYASVINCFDRNQLAQYWDSTQVFSGARKFEPLITLKMTGTESTAQWDEATNTLTVPYERMYEGQGEYNAKIMQRNAVAHELTHYHLNGFLEEAGGDYTKVPLWFREGLAEVCASQYYKNNIYNEYASNDPADFSTGYTSYNKSVSISRAEVIKNYLLNPAYNYRQTVESNAIDKVSWLSIDDMDTSINSYDHVYYGAVYSFMAFLIERYPHNPDENALDNLKDIAVKASKDEFAIDKCIGCLQFEDEKELKKEWFNSIVSMAEIETELGDAPLKAKVSVKLRDAWSYIKGWF